MWEIVRFIARSVSQTWQMPDHSIWEFRTRKLSFVFSKVMSWVAMDRATAIAELLHKNSYAELWKTESEKIKADIFEKGWKEEMQCFSQAYENNDYDSSLLLMHYYGFIDANDERFVKTVKSIRQHLQYKGLMYRYKSADDFGHPSSSFTVCNFWMIQALYAIGEKEEARRMFDSIVAYANHVGLYSEDFDFETGRLLGNFPQAYSHLAFINAATLFSEEKVYRNLFGHNLFFGDCGLRYIFANESGYFSLMKSIIFSRISTRKSHFWIIGAAYQNSQFLIPLFCIRNLDVLNAAIPVGICFYKGFQFLSERFYRKIVRNIQKYRPKYV
jgi:hypothetical protein